MIITNIMELYGVAGYHGKLSCLSAASGFPESAYSPATGTFAGKHAQAAVIAAVSGALMYTYDVSNTPTALSVSSYGMPLADTNTLILKGFTLIKNFKAIDAVTNNGGEVRYTMLFDPER